MTGQGRIAWQVIGVCLALATLAGAIYFAFGASNLYALARHDDTARLFRMPLDLSREGVYRASFRVNSDDAHWMRLEVETDAVGPARRTALEAMDRTSGHFDVTRTNAEKIMEADFSPADPLFARGQDGGSLPRVLQMRPRKDQYEFSLAIRQPATQPARVDLVGRCVEHEFARLAGQLASAVAIVLGLVFIVCGSLTGRSILRGRGKRGLRQAGS